MLKMNRRSVELGSEASYCERETWVDWDSRSSLSQVEEVTSQNNYEDVSCLKAERDALVKALSAERQRAATAARAHDARLAELHGVIAELVRRRAADKQSRAIPEEEVSDECESTTQPAGELENDVDGFKTDQNDTSSAVSPDELPTPQDPKVDNELPEDTTDTSAHEIDRPPGRADRPISAYRDNCDTSLDLSDGESEQNLSTARCWPGDSCRFETPPGCESRQSKLACRVKLRRTEDTSSLADSDGSWSDCMDEQLALKICGTPVSQDAGCVWRARYCRARWGAKRARCGVRAAAAALRRAHAHAHRHQAAATGAGLALEAADRALELYDVLLALAETESLQRKAVESVAWQILEKLESEETVSIGEPLLPPGPWLNTSVSPSRTRGPWTEAAEARLREHAARLKADTVRLRQQTHLPTDVQDKDMQSEDQFMAEMETAVTFEEMLSARVALLEASGRTRHSKSCFRTTRKTRASETDL